MPLQQSLEALGTPLSEVTFCVLDLETTGASPSDCGITEVGAVKVRRGEVIGTFESLVNPLQPIPAFVRVLTGINDEMVVAAPPIEEVLPSLLEFVRSSVLVAHNARFDVGFLNAALDRAGYRRLDNRVLDTALLARKILAGDVPNHRLETLARHLRCPHSPNHRAFTDVLATIDVLHHLIERVAGFGVTTLEDLAAMSRARLDGTFAKIRLADGLPCEPGIYRFLGDRDRILYIGKASNLRSRVRSYFYGDRRRGISDLLKQTQRIDNETFPTMLEAEVAEARAIASCTPPFNRTGKREGRWYLKAGVRGRAARLAPARSPKEDGAVYLGPFSSIRAVRSMIDALRDALSLHRCSDPSRCRGCAFAELDTCKGTQAALHKVELRKALTALVADAGPVLDTLAARMHRLADQQRFEEAAEARDRAALLESTLLRDARAQALVRAGRIRLSVKGHILEVSDGILDGSECFTGSYLSPQRAREPSLVASWIERNTASVEILSVSGTWSMPSGRRPSARFEVRRTG
jgi:DNA polymerase-3 subunit epsilon